MAQHAKLVLTASNGLPGGTLSFLMAGSLKTFTCVSGGTPTGPSTYNSVATLYDALNTQGGANNYQVTLVGSTITIVAKTYSSTHNFGTVTSVDSGSTVNSQQNASGADLSASFAKTNLSAPGSNDGTITLTVNGGNTPYTYLWNDGATTQNRTGLAPGSYSVDITETGSDGAPNQVVALNVTIAAAPVPVVFTGAVTHVAIFGQSTGAIVLTVTAGNAPFTYLWSNGATTKDLAGLPAGTYTVVVTSSLGATATQNFAVNQSGQLTVAAEVTNADVALVVTGGVGPYTFAWNDGPTTQNRTGLTVGTYTCVVTDSLGATASININIGEYSFFFSRNPVILQLAAGGLGAKYNLSFVLEVWLEEVYKSNVFTKKITLEHPASASGTTVFDVQSVLDVFVKAALPAVNQNTVSRADSLFKRFYLRHCEKYGASSTAEPALHDFVQELTSYVVLGGLSYEEFAAKTWFTAFQAVQKPFFTWEPNDKPVAADQPEYLYFMVPSFTVSSFLAKVQILYTDGSVGTHTFHTQAGTLRYELYLVPAGYAQLNLGSYSPSKTVKSWKVYCTDAGGNLLSEQRNYLLDGKYYPARRFFLYLNSIGGFNTLFAYGLAVKSLDIDQEELVRPLPFNYAIPDGATELVNKSGQQSLSLSTGFRPKAYIEALQDFLISEKVYLVENGRHIPVIISPDTVEIADEGETQAFLKFKVRPPRMYRYTPKL